MGQQDKLESDFNYIFSQIEKRAKNIQILALINIGAFKDKNLVIELV
jgi:hypothetical protein